MFDKYTNDGENPNKILKHVSAPVGGYQETREGNKTSKIFIIKISIIIIIIFIIIFKRGT